MDVVAMSIVPFERRIVGPFSTQTSPAIVSLPRPPGRVERVVDIQVVIGAELKISRLVTAVVDVKS